MEAYLRPPCESDYDTLTSWIPDARSCLLWAGPQLIFPFSAVALPALLVEGIDTTCHVMCDAHRHLLGFGQIVYRQECSAHLARIIIAPPFRNQGLAARLGTLLMAQAHRERTITHFTLNVFRDNLPAIKTYRNLGFVMVDTNGPGNTLFMQRRA